MASTLIKAFNKSHFNADAATRLKVALSTNSPLGTPPTPSTEMIMLIGPGFGKVIVWIPVPSAACWSCSSTTVELPCVAFMLYVTSFITVCSVFLNNRPN